MLAEKTALVTGASQGLGRAIARALATERVRLAIVARREELLTELSDEIVAAGGYPATVIVKDMLDEDAPAQIAAAAIASLGAVDILINSAGGSRKLTLDASEDRWDEGVTLNFTRLRQLTHAVLPAMMTRGWGRIVNITGKSEPEGLNAANAAKAAVHAWSKGLSREVGKHGITVNCIAPGRIMSEQIRRNYPAEERAAYSAARIPVGRYGEPEELACLATFLASPVASYISGTIIPVDGGLRQHAF